MFRLNAEVASRIIAEESALATLKGFPIEEVLRCIESAKIEDEEDAFEALMDAMYALRPQGVL